MQVDNVTKSEMEMNLANPTENIVCAIDIGTSKIAALVGRKNQFGKIEILGIGNCPSFGVQRGVVVNIAKTVESIKKAVTDAEQQSGIKFKQVHVGIAGQHIKSLQHRGILTRNNNETWISYEDIQKLKNEMYKLALPPGDKILHVLPQEYIVDNEPGIYGEPIGMMGVRLEGNFHIITGAIAAIQNIERCIITAGLEVASIELEPLASADAVLSKEELEGGVCLVDIGGGTTDIAIFENFVIRHTAVIPLGGNTITDDLKDFKILKDQAEDLKKQYGSAIPLEELRNKHVFIKGEGATKTIGKNEVNLLAVSKVISARMREILAHVAFQINLSKFEKKLIGGIVLTGGGSQLQHLARLTESETGQSARLGFPREHLASTKIPNVDNPIYATGIGLLIRGFKIREEAILNGQEAAFAPKETIKEEIVVKEEVVDTQIKENESFDISTKIEENKSEAHEIIALQGQGAGRKVSLLSSLSSKFGKWIQADIEDFESK
ncbi:MAG TPA: cell division protein FtsA [Chitinophagales bacterium]|jgi:cell division protein FtsA|nr:cell division protein FtsA [Chitinophagales bacterium]HQG37559.1 cell division protein FtsA [Chitinophagales bacterium]